MALHANPMFYNIPNSSTLIATGNVNRKAIHIQNISGGTVYLRFGAPVSLTQNIYVGISIAPGGDYINDIFCPIDDVHMLGDDVFVGNNIIFMETSNT